MTKERPNILHMVTPASNLSPFDVNMACDAGWDVCMPYTSVQLQEVKDLVQDAIFSRGPKGVKRTGMFFGGRDANLAMDMLAEARKAMVPPFEISLFADPSGAFTTAAAMVALVEHELKKSGAGGLKEMRLLVFGGTGPVGSTAALIAARAGAEAVIVSHEGLDKAQAFVDEFRQRYDSVLAAADGSSDEAIMSLLEGADVVFNAARAGVQVLTARHLQAAGRLKVACDVNAVPPEGIEGIDVFADGKPMETVPGAVAIGALTVGNVKYHTQHGLLKRMQEASEPQYLGFEEAFEVAREQVG